MILATRRIRTFIPLRLCEVIWLTALSVMTLIAMPTAWSEDALQLKVVGGLAGVSQYESLEKPFWEHHIEIVTKGHIKAEIHAVDRSGLRGQDMLRAMRSGIVPFGTALLALAAGDEPELNAVDLPVLNPDMPALRRTVELYRPHLRKLLQSKYDLELLAVYTYPAQVLFCVKQFSDLNDLAGRRIRTSSVGQSEMMAALGAIPIIIPFAEIVSAVQTGVVDCVVTGTLSGHEVGLSRVTSYVSPLAISWGLSFFAANATVWEALPADLRVTLREAIAGLEREIWDASERETVDGLACDTGVANQACGRGPGHMRLVPVTPEDDATRRRLLVGSVLPAWIRRCGWDCVAAWNSELAPSLGVSAAGE